MIETNIKEVQERIRQACERSGRSVSEITLIAVSKTKPFEMIEEAYLLSCSADTRIWKHPDMEPRMMVRARYLIGGTLFSLAAMLSERFQGDEEDLVIVLMEEATRLEQDVQKLCE